MVMFGILLLFSFFRSSTVSAVNVIDEIPANITILKQRDALPEIQDGDPCIPGKMYKLNCNTCQCTKTQELMCTKMACVDWKRFQSLHQKKKALRNTNKKQKVQSKKGNGPLTLPKVMKGVKCKPGKIYRNECSKCFCTDKRRIQCSSKKDACKSDKQGNPVAVTVPEDVSAPIKIADLEDTLPSASEKCEPGKSYKVDCNECICLETFDLLCTRRLCISYDDMHRVAIKKLSGKPCSETVTNNCNKCDCIDGQTQCSEVPNCKVNSSNVKVLLSLGDEPKPHLDPVTDKCIPNTVYRIECNKCYCQPDSSLRCTQRTCLNHSQLELLQKQREYLDKHGL